MRWGDSIIARPYYNSKFVSFLLGGSRCYIRGTLVT